MKDIGEKVLSYLDRREVSYADVRVIESREREISTKNGKMGSAQAEESLGLGVRVLVNGCWGFASTDDLSPDSLAATAKRAVEIARASARSQESRHRARSRREDRRHLGLALAASIPFPPRSNRISTCCCAPTPKLAPCRASRWPKPACISAARGSFS